VAFYQDPLAGEDIFARIVNGVIVLKVFRAFRIAYEIDPSLPLGVEGVAIASRVGKSSSHFLRRTFFLTFFFGFLKRESM
jgi:hypothetical protein